MRESKQFTFGEDEVREWCEQAGDDNALHLNEDEIKDNPLFDERVVPGMMLLDKVSGLITQWAETQQGTPVLSRLSNTVFQSPVYFDETVEISIEAETEDTEESMYVLRFEVGSEPRASGYTTVYLL